MPDRDADAWLDKLCDEIAGWIALAYQKTIKKSLMLGPEERDELLEMLRDPKTFIAEDLDDLLAVLKHLDQIRTVEGAEIGDKN